MQTKSKVIHLDGVIPEHLFNKRLDQCLAEMFHEYSRSKIKEWIEGDCVTVDGQVNNIPRTKMKGRECIIIEATQLTQTASKAEEIALDIVFEDAHILVINKPAGLVVHPGAGNPTGTMLNALLAHVPDIDKIPRAGIVHRLDKDTTGLMVVAKTLPAQTHLVEQLQSRSMGREYEAIVMGNLIAGGSVDAAIGRHPSKRTLMAVRETGKPAVTHYRVIEKFRAHTHLRLKLESGRTHQIRVHMTHIKHPLVGDNQYGGRPRPPKKAVESFAQALRDFKRQALHAAQLTLNHPNTNEEMSWQVPLPSDFNNMLAIMRQDVADNQDLMEY
ncbi:23S rRNA pseudouridine(1911/1915/1917) synthase RluD [Agaribacter marinus]|uniref:Pseudouridine synthase n=1 Tax=Agaribacter marinus TaxID=1431249 RepID=A0AA37WK79_9ALTE|nr:23S rRNA pseudouridine(1911/1915/1917) synthase RluD [Agaribacter marinus]GLR73082.1 pseudouridine synthase [Agaribacter marinus]